MYRERLVGCLDCGDRFKIIYDSKKEQQDKYTCKCGKLVCYPDSYGSFSYDRNGNPEKIPYDEQEQKKENTLQRGFSRVEQGFDQWQKDQEAKRLELKHQAELKRQQEREMKLAEQKASPKLSKGGWSR